VAIRKRSGKSETTIRRATKALRRVIEHSNDPCEQRIAYGMETALLWASQRTVGWSAMDVEARELAKLLREELSV
jgi:hypothetical protein